MTHSVLGVATEGSVAVTLPGKLSGSMSVTLVVAKSVMTTDLVEGTVTVIVMDRVDVPSHELVSANEPVAAVEMAGAVELREISLDTDSASSWECVPCGD